MLCAPPASGLAFQDLGSEAEDAVAAASSEDEDDGSSSSGSEDSDAAEETEESAAARTPRSRRACVEAKASSAPPPATPKVEPVQPIVVEEKKEEEVEPAKPPARRVDEFRPHAICKVCQVLMSPDKFQRIHIKFSCRIILVENLFSSWSSRVWIRTFFIYSKSVLPPPT